MELVGKFGMKSDANIISCVLLNVSDPYAPTLTCPPSVDVTSDIGYPTAIINWPEPIEYKENSGTQLNITCTRPSGHAFPPGVSEVYCRSTPDPSGNVGSCKFVVTVFCKYQGWDVLIMSLNLMLE